MIRSLLTLVTLSAIQSVTQAQGQSQTRSPQTPITWGEVVTIDPQTGSYGSEYGRLVQIGKTSWLAGYTTAEHKSYRQNPAGGLSLSISRSDDGGRHWRKIASISQKGRDLDNAMLLKLPDSTLLLACRSVRWQESYRLLIYQSEDAGKSWKELSVLDANEGTPGSLGHPDKGVYEPHLYLLKDGRVAALYANEKHVTDADSYSQIISEKISPDGGRSWGSEIRVATSPGDHASRPGMPVWTKMKDGRFIEVYEVCGPQKCDIYYKTSQDGVHWPIGLGKPADGQSGAPFVLALKDGRLLLTSNRGNISLSDDYGKTWQVAERPWSPLSTFEQDWTGIIWSSLYQTTVDSICIVTSVKQSSGAHEVQIRFGKLND